MIEFRDTSGSLLKEFTDVDEAHQYFDEFSVTGDYLWDADQGVMLIARITSLVERY